MIQLILNLILISSALSNAIEPLPDEIINLVNSDEFIDFINTKQSSWKAQKYNRTIKDYKRLLGGRKTNPLLKPKPTIHSESIQIPESFDSRTNWPGCSSVIGTIVDQSRCGSCWAVSAASVMSDRRCIASNGTLKVPVSSLDLISCCADGNGKKVCTGLGGCYGGWPNHAFDYWKLYGLVTGGKYDSNEGCKPYPFQPCDLNEGGKYVQCDQIDLKDTPKCESKCTNDNLDYESDKTYGASDAEVFETVEDIQREILLNGPVAAVMDVYADFVTYKSGVYKHVVDKRYAQHAVRIIGWGIDEASGLPYWQVANSDNEDWGEKGWFRILRGENECSIEKTDVCASKPKV